MSSRECTGGFEEIIPMDSNSPMCPCPTKLWKVCALVENEASGQKPRTKYVNIWMPEMVGSILHLGIFCVIYCCTVVDSFKWGFFPEDEQSKVEELQMDFNRILVCRLKIPRMDKGHEIVFYVIPECAKISRDLKLTTGRESGRSDHRCWQVVTANLYQQIQERWPRLPMELPPVVLWNPESATRDQHPDLDSWLDAVAHSRHLHHPTHDEIPSSRNTFVWMILLHVLSYFQAYQSMRMIGQEMHMISLILLFW